MLPMGQKERVLKIIMQKMMTKGIAGTCACGFWREKISEYDNTLFFPSFPLHQFLLHFFYSNNTLCLLLVLEETSKMKNSIINKPISPKSKSFIYNRDCIPKEELTFNGNKYQPLIQSYMAIL